MGKDIPPNFSRVVYSASPMMLVVCIQAIQQEQIRRLSHWLKISEEVNDTKPDDAMF